jgi:glutathione S-transferase
VGLTALYENAVNFVPYSGPALHETQIQCKSANWETRVVVGSIEGPYKYPNRHAKEGQTPEHHRALAVSLMLEALEQRLQQHRFLGGAEPCATDLAVFPFVRQFAAVDPAWWESTPLPAVRAWLAAWVSSPLFEACMARPVGGSAQ